MDASVTVSLETEANLVKEGQGEQQAAFQAKLDKMLGVRQDVGGSLLPGLQRLRIFSSALKVLLRN